MTPEFIEIAGGIQADQHTSIVQELNNSGKVEIA